MLFAYPMHTRIELRGVVGHGPGHRVLCMRLKQLKCDLFFYLSLALFSQIMPKNLGTEAKGKMPDGASVPLQHPVRTLRKKKREQFSCAVVAHQYQIPHE